MKKISSNDNKPPMYDPRKEIKRIKDNGLKQVITIPNKLLKVKVKVFGKSAKEKVSGKNKKVIFSIIKDLFVFLIPCL